MVTVVTEKSRVNSDVFLETPSQNYGFVSATIKNANGAAVDINKYDMIGRPVKLVSGQWTLAIAGTDEGTVDGLVFNPQEGLALANNGISARKFTILIRGAAVVNLSNIASGFTKATLAATLLALSPPILHKESSAVVADEAV
jgi:hypothetical protein